MGIACLKKNWKINQSTKKFGGLNHRIRSQLLAMVGAPSKCYRTPWPGRWQWWRQFPSLLFRTKTGQADCHQQGLRGHKETMLQLVERTLWWTNILPWKDPPFLMGKSTISMAIFNSYVSSPEGRGTGPPHNATENESSFCHCIRQRLSWGSPEI